MEYFRHKVVWLTGASSGIGKALARALAAKGSYLILSARNEALLSHLAEELGEKNTRVLPLDLNDVPEMRRYVNRAMAYFGRIDILFNNAGVSQRELLHRTDFSVIQNIMNVNFTGGAALSTWLLPHFYSRRTGQIVVVSSIMGKFGTPLRTGYCASKFALHGFYEALSVEAAPHGVAVTLIVPGWVRTEISQHALTGNGTLHGTVDYGSQKAHPPERYISKILASVEKKRFETIIALNARTRLALFLSRRFPALLRRLLGRVHVT